MKKNLLIVSLLLFNFSVIFSQKYQHAVGKFQDIKIGTYNFYRNINSDKIIEKVNLFDSWDNINEVFTNNNKKFKLENINIDVEQNKFIFRVRDSIYFYDFKKLNYININSKKYKTFSYKDKKDKIFQVLSENNDNYLLKGFELSITKEKIDPYTLMKTEGKYSIKTKYFIKKNNEIKRIKLKKKDILSILADKKTAILKYAKKHNFSFSKENDVKEIFNFYNNN